jgi:hypothetical protein
MDVPNYYYNSYTLIYKNATYNANYRIYAQIKFTLHDGTFWTNVPSNCTPRYQSSTTCTESIPIQFVQGGSGGAAPF